MSTPITTTRVVYALDCPDAVELAAFYSNLLGWEMKLPAPDDPDADCPEWVALVPPNVERCRFSLGFQRIENYRAPNWPDGPIPQQAHLDFWVPSIPEAEQTAIELGATRHVVQPSDNGEWVVFLDPVGHPFCLCTE